MRMSTERCIWFLLVLAGGFFVTALSAGCSTAEENKRLPGKAGMSPVGDNAEELLSGYQVGFTILEETWTSDDGQRKTILIPVWYPTVDKPEEFSYLFDDNRVSSSLALDGKADSSRRHPLIIYAHGAAGAGTSSAFITETLARKGYVVAAVDFTDEFSQVRSSGSVSMGKFKKLRMMKWMHEVRTLQEGRESDKYRKLLAFRPMQLRLAIDRMLAENKSERSLLHGSMDEGRIGLLGHSFGAWTVMMASGADPSYSDARVKATVALSGPVNEYVYSVYKKNEVADIHIPIMFMYGEKEVSQGRGDDKGLLYDRARPPRFLLGIEGADHFSFSGGLRKEFGSMEDYLRRDPARRAITRYTLAFFDYFLQGKSTAKEVLDTRGDRVGTYHKDFMR